MRHAACLLAQARSGWDRLLGLRELRVGEGETYFALANPLPGWAWVLVGLAASGFAWWAYHRITGPRPLRGALALLRALVVLLIVVLLCGPQLVRPSERVEPGVLVMLVDRSASMRVTDMPGGPDQAVSRDAALRGSLALQWYNVAEGWPEDREALWLGFGQNVFALGAAVEPNNQVPIEPAEESGAVIDPGGSAAVALPELGEPDQPRTALRSAVEDAVRRAAGRPIAGVVVFSDGQSGQTVSAALRSRLGQAGVRVFAVPLGAAEPGVDWAVARVDAPARAFAKDAVPVSVVIERRGGNAEAATDGRATVTLLDTRGTDDPADDVVLDERDVDATALSRPVRLEGLSETEGVKAWAVTVEPVTTSASEDLPGRELNTANNREGFEVEIVDRPIRVLYVEGLPRWEYRYLKNLLVREPSIDSSVLLLSADAGFAQEGDTPITRLPADAEEFARYDVVILGDVPGAYLSEEQVALLRDLVSRRGAGLLWVGGPNYTPTSWAGSRLADLLPMTDPGGVGVWPGAALGVRPTALAEALSVLRLEPGNTDDNEANTGGALFDDWPEGLAPLRWVQTLGALKPVAEVLAVASPQVGDADAESPGDVYPVVVRMRYGSGQAVYVGTDETWRWRRGVGERYPERFWVQLIRMLGRGAVVVGDERARLTASTRTALEGETVVLELSVEDPGLLPGDARDVTARIEPADANTAGAGAEVVLRRRPPEAGTTETARVFRGTWIADRAGLFLARPTVPALASLGVSAELEVVSPDDELRRPEADHAKLTELAEATGGVVIPLDGLARLNDPSVVRRVARRVADDRAESVAHSPLAFGLLLGLLAVEWVVRRAMRLA